jgi:hypothetical protein
VSDGRQETITLDLEESAIAAFFPLLPAGVRVAARVGSSVQAFLSEELGLSSDYIEGRISTITLDGMPVDDPGTAILREGSQLALSAALPGLFGASVRKKGVCSSLRTSITCGKGEQGNSPRAGVIILKLFNLLIAEMGPRVLERGIILDAEGEVLLAVRFTKASSTPGDA